MNLCIYKSKKLRQKPNILTIEQSKELTKLIGLKAIKNVTDQGLTPTHLFRLRKRKLEVIYNYLLKNNLIHDKEPNIESLQTHQLGEYLLNTIYPGFPACKAKNLAYTDYRECREKELGQLNPLAYDFVPTTEIFDRLDEVYRLDINFQEIPNKQIQLPMSSVKKSIERIKLGNHEKSFDHVQYHLYLWNSTRTLLKPFCKSLKLNSTQIWNLSHEKVIHEGFMHIDITSELITALKNNTKQKMLQFEIELNDNEEYNISHISLCAVIKKSTKELICDLYLQSAIECIAKTLLKSQHPSDTQEIIVHLLKQYHQFKTMDERLANSENIFMTCKSNTFNNNYSEDDTIYDELMVSLNYNDMRLKHPIKSVHCKHRNCFEALEFFDQYANVKIWHCPICKVHIKGFEELRIDYNTKVALNQYPDQDTLYVLNNMLLSEPEFVAETSHIMLEPETIIILDEEESTRKRKKRFNNNNNSVQKRYRLSITHI